MADNVYNLKFTLSNGDVIDAGQITAPQGPKGDKGDSADIPYSSSTPFMDGVGSVGSANTVARGDHRHPSDTSRQEKLVSGTNIKTINGQSVLGSGDIPISGGGSEYANTSEIVDNAITLTSTSTLNDLVTQILAQKTKVTRSSDITNLSRILGTPKYSHIFGATFKVINSQTTSYAPKNHYYPDLVIECIGWGSGHYYKQYIVNYLGHDSSVSGTPSLTGWVELLTEYNPYPVGSVYISTTSYVSPPPVIHFGGTWEQIKDVFLLAAGDTYTAGSTGGSADAVVVSHRHYVTQQNEGWNISNTTGLGGTETLEHSVTLKDTSYDEQSNATVSPLKTTTDGESGTGKNMPPYLAVYMWRRVA